MLNNKTLIASGLLSLGLALTGCANSNANSHTHEAKAMPAKGDKAPQNMKKMGEHHFDKLNLTDAQKQQVKALEDQTKNQMEQLHATLKSQTDQIIKQKQAGADTATLLKLYEQREATEAQHKALHKASQDKLLSILTPEQKLKFYEGHEMMKMHQNHPPMGDRPDQPPPMPPKANSKKAESN